MKIHNLIQEATVLNFGAGMIETHGLIIVLITINALAFLVFKGKLFFGFGQDKNV